MLTVYVAALYSTVYGALDVVALHVALYLVALHEHCTLHCM